MNLQEELDELKVHISLDKATIQELNRCMAEKREGKFFVQINASHRNFLIT